MLSVGVDIIEVPRVARALARWGARFLGHVYTEREVALCRGRAPELAARFAAKEAVSKALGTGLAGIGWTEMEVLADRRGRPYLVLHGRAAARARTLGLVHWSVSLSHTAENAVAMVVAGSRAV